MVDVKHFTKGFIMRKLDYKSYCVLLVAFLLGIYVCTLTKSEEYGYDKYQVHQDYTSEENRCFQMINDFRVQHGLHPVQWSDELANASREWSSTMRRTGRFQHATNRNGAGENIAKGREDGAYTFNQWKNSAGHRRFLLSPSTTEAGVGQSSNYWTYRARGNREVARTVERSSYQVAQQSNSLTYAGEAQYKTVSEPKVTQTHRQPRKPVRTALKKIIRGR